MEELITANLLLMNDNNCINKYDYLGCAPQYIWKKASIVCENGHCRIVQSPDWDWGDFDTILGYPHRPSGPSQIIWYTLLPNCPCCIDVSSNPPMLNKHDATDKGWGRVKKANPEHPGATWEVRWVDPLGILLQGQQCTYDDKGRLITEPPAAGTPDMVSFDGDKHSVFSLHFWGHTICDWSTYKILFYNRDIYFRHWPPNNGNNCPRNFGNQK